MNIKNLFKFVLVWVALAGVLPATAAFKDVKIDLTNGNFLTETEIQDKSSVSFGVAIADDGTQSRVAADDATANIVIGGSYHSNEHGLGWFTSTVKVEGTVKIGMGSCAWGGDVKVTNAAGETVVTFNTNTGACYHNDKVNNIVYGYYKGEATTLTISGGSYTPYISVEAIDESEIPNNMAVTYSLGDTGAEGILPADAEVELGTTFALPVNRTLYVEGKTMTGWTDGTTTYALGQEVKAEGAELALTPVFTDNEVSLADRTETVSVTWDFQQKNGAPVVGVQGKTMIWVAQAVVNGKTIDVKMPIDATNGKVANGSWQDWAQINGGTILTIPACKGTVVSLESYSATTTTTIAGEVINQGTTTPTYTYEGSEKTIDIVIGDGSYWRTVKVELPVSENEGGEEGGEEIEIPEKSVEIGTVEAVIGEGDLVEINNCKQKVGQLIDSSYDGSYVTFIVNTTKAGEYLFTSMIGTQVDGAAITLGYLGENGEYVASEKKDIENTGNWNNGPNYTWKFNLEANKVYTFKILCHTANGSGYCVNLFAMNIGMEGLITPEYTVTYGHGDVAAEGVVPTAVKVKAGQKVKIPANFTLYAEGKTLTGWTDGSATYAIGQEFTVTSEMALTPVFTDNKVSLDDRTKEVTLRWDFQKKNGAPAVGYEGQTGLIWVTQATVEGEVIDVKCNFDANNGGKVNNGNWDDWCQMNSGTKFTIPSCKGAVVSIEAYSAPTTTTIDGQTDYTANGNVISYTVANTANTIDIVIGDGSYYRWIQAVLPFVEKSYAGTVFEDAEASAIWAFTSNATDPAITSPKGAFTMNSVSTGSFTMGTGSAKSVNYVTVMPADASDPTIMWTVKPAKGLTFTPVEVSAKIQRFGTDGGTLDIYGRTGDGQEVLLESGLIPLRNNKTIEAGDDKHAGNEKLCDEFTLDVPGSLASTEGFSLVVKVVGLGSSKTIGFSDVRIIGTVNGTVADVAKYSLTASGNMAEAGKVTVYPASDKYDEGTELTLTAAEDFGYNFVNWTNAAGEEISVEPKFVYVVEADEVLTANFVKVNTYELAMTIDGGANDYMVSYNPVPTIVDGKQMYEEGTVVEVAAASNPILTFTNWSNGESNPTQVITMDGNKSYTAVYSAADYIVGWDFIRRGGSGRPADFASTVDNETAVLYMTNANGDVQGWLDKSKEAAGGYESFVGAAVNWKKLGEYWYEFKMNASEFTNIRVDAELMYNYNAYTTVIVEYSIDGTTWTEAGRVTMAGAKTENPVSVTLGEDANNQAMVYVRFRPDLDGAVDGSSAPDNDGTCISNIYVYGAMKLVDDGQDPTLISSIPTEGATGASATGKIVLNFHEKVALVDGITASLSTEHPISSKPSVKKELEGMVSGKTITFSYMGLEYNTEYYFYLPEESVKDLTGNSCKTGILIKFTTIAPPTVTPGQYDAVVANVDEFLAALKKADGSNRFRIFLHDGTYDLGTACLTTVPGNVSLIGESMENTIIVNDPQSEGISVTATLCTGGENIYMQDLTLKSVDYDRLRDTGASMGRCVVLQENASKAVYKNVRLLSNQDTYYTRATKRTYWEGGMITGTVDYLCGGGDVFFNGVTLYNNKRGSGDCITAPATSSAWGYVFSNCTIDGAAEQDGNYSLGRPWQGSPRAVYINTTMKIIPSAAGWSDMGAVPGLFAEYNSHTESGAPVDCSNRKTSFSSNGQNVAVSYNPVLTEEEAAKFTVENVLAGDDGWQPQLLTEQANTPNVTVESGILKWNASEYVFCYAICKNGKIVEFTNETSWTIPADATDEDYFSVRAANNMGGLCPASVAVNKNGATGIIGVVAEGEVLSTEIFNLNGVQLNKLQQGINIIRKTYVNGAVTVEKKMME
ncbi:MAG: Ig-like domain-containing protein [Bacteroidaceae bacterium]|nr:Ig-like domain-containing protein [Bacteroidaceae bacterium]